MTDRLGSDPNCGVDSFCATSGQLLDLSELVSSLRKQ